MPDPSTYRPAPGAIPVEPGVYKFRDPHGRVIYVGKAKSLRQRLNSYFADLAALHPRTRQMVTAAASVEWTVVRTEVEALQLEYSWIKEFDPRFNVRYRDDKSYPSLAVTLGEEFPRLQVMRGPKRKGVRYFGPYSHAWAIRETLDLLLRVFPARTCGQGVFRRAGQIGRPCLLGYIDKCSAPCVGRVSAEQHRAIVEDFCEFMAGRTDQLVKRLERQMRAASAALEFERAARLRDDLDALRRALEKQAVVFGDGTDADVVAFARDEFEAAVQVFHVRGGRVRGQRGWVIDTAAAVDGAMSIGELVEQFVAQCYGLDVAGGHRGEGVTAGRGDGAGGDRADSGGGGATDGDGGGAGKRGGAGRAAGDGDGDGGAGIPREILVPELPENAAVLAQWLTARRGARVALRVPRRGDKRALLETVARNAEQAFAQHKLKRASDLTARSRALAELQEALGLAEAPLRIECFDISHVQGTDVVASMVVFEDGLARRGEYRRFAMRGGVADTDWIAEVVRRRFAHQQDGSADTPIGEGGPLAPDARPPADGARPPGAGVVSPGADPITGRPRRFAYPPNLLVVDGGAPQVAAAQRVLDELGVVGLALIGLAKRLEEVWEPGQEYPTILPRGSEALYLLQRVRDEAHRFAITYHRQKRSKSMTASALDGIPGLGEARRAALLARFGSLRKLRAADVDAITAVPGIGRRIAEAIVAALGERPSGPAVNVTTGEVLVD
ncbi:MAG: excinuclease ABC subunit UvrC [Actinomycetia bacterium]|nr:excinuclease ABC subunit UvrC [Actinomycetes bacterium]